VRAIVLGATTSTAGLGGAALLALLTAGEAGVPIPVPSDLLMFGVGERVASGALPLWVGIVGLEIVAVVGTAVQLAICRGAGRRVVDRLGPRIGLTPERLARTSALLERRGAPALAIGRATPGLRTITVVAAGASGLRTRRALPALVLGSSLFLQLHLVLGMALGPLARDAFDRAKGPVALGGVAVIVLALAFWIVRGGRRRGLQAFTEAACPLCLGLVWLSDRAATVSASSVEVERWPTTNVS
jgi:membrane-associated protein